LGKEKNVGSYS